MIVATLLIAYFAFGALFAIAFVIRGVDRIDATEKTRGFRLLIFPGSAVLWPILLSRWIGGAP